MNTAEFKSHVKRLASVIGVSHKIHAIHIRKMKRKIASCSTMGRLTFDPSILEENSDLVQEIIVHELLHLRYPNHGKMFKIMLKKYSNMKLGI